MEDFPNDTSRFFAVNKIHLYHYNWRKIYLDLYNEVSFIILPSSRKILQKPVKVLVFVLYVPSLLI